MSSRFIMPRQGVKGQNLTPADGAKLFFKVIGQGIGGTNKSTFLIEALTPGFENTNPVIADSKGLFEEIWLDGDYDVFLTDKNDIGLWGPETIRELVKASSLNPITTNVLTTSKMTALTVVAAGVTVVETKEFATGTGGTGLYDTITGTGTSNGRNILAHDTLDFSFVLREGDQATSLAAYGATVSPTDITTIITQIQNNNDNIYVPEGTFLTTLKTLDGNYVGPGKIVTSSQTLYEGANSQAYTGAILSNDAENRLKSKGLKGKLKSSVRLTSDVYTVFNHRGGDNWLEVLMTNSGEVDPGIDTPWKVTQQKLFVSQGWQVVKDASLGGTWSILVSGDPDLYPGHELAQSNSSGNTLTWTFTAGGDFELGFTGDTDGGIVEVTINGGSPIDVDTFNSVAQSHRTFVKFATRQDKIAQTIVVTSTTRKNPSSSGTQANITSIRISKGGVEPYSSIFEAKPWIDGATSRVFEEVQGPTGRFYFSTLGGTNGSTAPVHASGTVTDGSVLWTAMAKTSFSQQETIFQVFGSEMEYAYEFDFASGGPQDVGGNVHGNEFVNSVVVSLDQEAITVVEGETFIADLITIRQNITDFYDPFTSKTDIATVTQFHEFDYDSMRVHYNLDWLVSGDVGFFYAAMWPILPYNAGPQYKIFETMFTPRRTFDFKTFESSLSTILGNAKDSFMQADGRLYVTEGSGGVPTSDNGTIGFSVGLKADISGLEYFNKANELNAGLDMNANSGQFSGFSSWLGKMYFQYAKSGQLLAVTSSDFVNHSSTYYTVVTDNDKDLSSL